MDPVISIAFMNFYNDAALVFLRNLMRSRRIFMKRIMQHRIKTVRRIQRIGLIRKRRTRTKTKKMISK